MSIDLIKTCDAFPEQYDAFFDGKQVGYLRLRHGTFRVECPNVGGETVYTAHPEGDGCFTETERPVYLQQASDAIKKWLK